MIPAPIDRVFHQMENPAYGAVRRLQRAINYLCPDLDALDAQFYAEWGTTWDDMFHRELAKNEPEERAARTVLFRIIDIYPD